MIDQNKVSRWIRRACGIHLLILLILCLTLPAIATTPIQQTIFNIVTQDLKIITQMSTSSYPFLSVMSSVYALVSGLGLFLVFLLILKKLEPNYPFRAVLYARFAEQLSPIEQLKWFRLVGKFVTFVLTLGLISFHFLFLIMVLNKVVRGMFMFRLLILVGVFLLYRALPVFGCVLAGFYCFCGIYRLRCGGTHVKINRCYHLGYQP